MSQRINIEGIFKFKNGRQRYFRDDRWMKGKFVPIQILEEHFRPFSIKKKKKIDVVEKIPTFRGGV